MSTIQELFQQAQLAEAAYANFVAFPNNPKGALQNEGFRKGTMGSGLANCIKVPVEGFGESRGLSRAFLDTGEGMAEGRDIASQNAGECGQRGKESGWVTSDPLKF